MNQDRACAQCSYSLRGLPVDGRCPECGHPVIDSLRGNLLQFAGREYVAKVHSGVSLVLIGILLLVVVNILSFVAAAIRSTSSFGSEANLVASLLSFGVSVLILIGYLRYSAPDPGFLGNERPDAARKVLRVAVVIQALFSLLQTLWQLGIFAGMQIDPHAALIVTLGLVGVWGIAWITQFFAVMSYTRWMARRVPDHYLWKRAGMYQWLLPVIAILGLVILYLGPLIAVIMYWNLLDRLRKHTRSILKTGEPARLRKMINPALVTPGP